MKKHDEGYTLILVLIVLLVMTFTAVSILSVSASNIRKQGESVAAMKNKYKAAGEIEKAVASIDAELAKISNGFGNAFLTGILDEDTVSFSEPVWNEEENGITVHLESHCDTVIIVCNILIKGSEIEATAEGKFDITDPELVYTGYEVVTGEQTAAEPENGGAEG